MSRYDNDLRRRVAKRLVDGLSAVGYREVSKLFEVGVTTLRKWKKKLDLGTLYDKIHTGGHPVVYDLEGLKQFVNDNPDKYIREIKVEFFEAKGNKASFGGIHKALDKMDIRLKKKSLHLEKALSKKKKNIKQN
jgi:transposase